MMQLKSLSVRNFRKFVEPVYITGLTPGINIIAGDNEDGKSTLVQAIKAALYTKHSTSATQSLQPYNSSALPEVELEFDLNGLSYRLRKTFGKKGTAELRAASAIFNGSEAEEQLQRLLSLGNEKSKENSSIWNVLWVEQGTAFLSPQIGDAGKQTLHTALESELGTIVSGEDGQNLLRRINDLYLQWFTRKSSQHSANSEFRKAEKELEEIAAQHAKLSAEFESYKSTLTELEAARTKLQDHEQNATMQAANSALAAATLAAEQIEKSSAALEKLQAIEARAAAQYRERSEIWQTRRQLVKAVEETQAALAEVRPQLAASTAAFEAESKRLHECQQQEDGGERLLSMAESSCTQLEAATGRAQLLELQNQLQEKLLRAQAAQQQAVETRARANVIKTDRAALEKLRLLDRQVVQAEAQLQAVGTKLTFRPQAGKSATANGALVESNQPLLVTTPTSIDLDGWGVIEITPGAEGLDQLRASALELRHRFAAALTHLGVATIEQAEENEREKSALLQQADEQLRDVLRFAPAGTPALADELAAVRAKLESLPTQGDAWHRPYGNELLAGPRGNEPFVGPNGNEAVGQTDANEPIAGAPDKPGEPAAALGVPQLEKALLAARTERDSLRKKQQPLREAAQSANTRLVEIDVRVQTLTGQEKALLNALQSQSAKLTQAREQEGDEHLEQQVMEHRRLKEESSQKREELQGTLQGQNPGAAALAVQQAKERLEITQREIQSLRERQSELSGSLQTFGKAGIAEEYQKISDKKEQLEALAARLAKKSAAVKLLYDTITAAESSSKSELIQPLVNHLEPYIKQVFDDGKLILDATTYAITGLQRAGGAEQYDSLSLGTREQLSVLMRLAFAHVLVENKCPAVVILDDALVYSDFERFLKMQAALTTAAAFYQVLILTCRLRDWENLQAPVVSISSKAEDRAADAAKLNASCLADLPPAPLPAHHAGYR